MICFYLLSLLYGINSFLLFSLEFIAWNVLMLLLQLCHGLLLQAG